MDLDKRYTAWLRELQLEQASAPPAAVQANLGPLTAEDGRRHRATLAAALDLVDDYHEPGTPTPANTAPAATPTPPPHTTTAAGSQLRAIS